MDRTQLEMWVIEAQAGSEQAFDALCRHYYPALVRFAFKMAGDESLAHDAVQNSWIKMVKSLSNLQDARAFRSWIYRAVRWQTLDLIKRKTSEPIQFSVDELSEVTLEDRTTHDSSEQLSHIRSLLGTLSVLDQQAIHLFYLEDMRLSEISHILEIPVGTVKSRLNRARNNLKRQLDEE